MMHPIKSVVVGGELPRAMLIQVRYYLFMFPVRNLENVTPYFVRLHYQSSYMGCWCSLAGSKAKTRYWDVSITMFCSNHVVWYILKKLLLFPLTIFFGQGHAWIESDSEGKRNQLCHFGCITSFCYCFPFDDVSAFMDYAGIL